MYASTQSFTSQQHENCKLFLEWTKVEFDINIGLDFDNVKVVELDNVKVIEFVYDKVLPDDEEYLFNLIENGQGWIETTKIAVRSNYIEKAKWLMVTGMPTIETCVKIIVQNSNIVLLNWAYDVFDHKYFSDLEAMAIKYCSVVTLEWMLSKGLKLSASLDKVFSKGNIDMAKLYLENGRIRPWTITYEAARTGNYFLFEWLLLRGIMFHYTKASGDEITEEKIIAICAKNNVAIEITEKTIKRVFI